MINYNGNFTNTMMTKQALVWLWTLYKLSKRHSYQFSPVEWEQVNDMRYVEKEEKTCNEKTEDGNKHHES